MQSSTAVLANRLIKPYLRVIAFEKRTLEFTGQQKRLK